MKGATTEHEEATRWALRLLAAAWLAFAGIGGWILFLFGGLSAATFFGDPPDPSDLRTAAWLTVGAGLGWALGPLGVWFATRKRGWLIGAVIVFGLACVVAAAYAVQSFGATGSR